MYIVQKSWNCYNDFQVNMKRLPEPVHLFLLKDTRFGALCKTYAAMCFHWEDFQKLSKLSWIHHKWVGLSCSRCLGHEICQSHNICNCFLGISHELKFPCNKISNKATHTSLAEFLKYCTVSCWAKKSSEHSFYLRNPFSLGFLSRSLVQWRSTASLRLLTQ